jgi:hypothetical protein
LNLVLLFLILLQIGLTRSLPRNSHIHATVRETLVQFLSPNPTRHSIAAIVGLFHRIAAAYLGKKAYSGSLDPSRFGLSVDDLALDCIAPLFSRDAEGAFGECVTYFRGVDLQVASEADVMALCRRLVFGQVNQELFTRYGEIDPTLHKIIRNLKAAIHREHRFCLDCSRDEVWIVFGRTPDGEESRPIVPPEILEAHLSEILARSANLRPILEAAASFFADQEIYRPSYPLTSFAILVRSGFERGGDHIPEFHEPVLNLTSDEVLGFIDGAIAATRTAQHREYVGKGKMDATIFERYFVVIREVLAADFVGDNGQDGSYFEYLRKHLGPLSKEEYKMNHRSYLEYLARLTRARLLTSIRGEL